MFGSNVLADIKRTIMKVWIRLNPNYAKLCTIEQENQTIQRLSNEILWAEVFNSTVCNSQWLKDKSFSPGRWAVGYPYLYVLYRVLNEVRPKRIIELGLGQSTRMIAQYAEMFDDVEHFIVEHDQGWIDFFSNDFRLSEHTKIVRLDTEMISYKEAAEVRAYAGFSETFSGMQFDLISIDAPVGYDMKLYSRIDILKLLPDCLSESFVVLLDDYDRDTEKAMAKELTSVLEKHQVAYCTGIYSGSKDLYLWTSPNQVFLCSM